MPQRPMHWLSFDGSQALYKPALLVITEANCSRHYISAPGLLFLVLSASGGFVKVADLHLTT